MKTWLAWGIGVVLVAGRGYVPLARSWFVSYPFVAYRFVACRIVTYRFVACRIVTSGSLGFQSSPFGS